MLVCSTDFLKVSVDGKITNIYIDIPEDVGFVSCNNWNMRFYFEKLKDK